MQSDICAIASERRPAVSFEDIRFHENESSSGKLNSNLDTNWDGKDCNCTHIVYSGPLNDPATYSETPEYVSGTFEGPEKTMEVQFQKGSSTNPMGLRSLARSQLDSICAAARCTILSKTSNRHCDAYVLSESSLFVYKHKLIMKTCGTTTLLRCIGTILSYADELGMDLTWLCYSRKNLFFPTAQQWPHSSFDDETRYLDSHEKLQNRLKGVGYILGPLTGDHWYVYVANHEVEEAVPKMLALPSSTVPKHSSTYVPQFNERSVNIMMFDMAPSVAAQFFIANTPGGGKEMTRVSGIDTLCPGATIDEAHFTPCGYSMNALLHDAYYTIHVTPEAACSYASFETNAVLPSYSALIRNVLRVFRPNRFLITTFGDEEAFEHLVELPTSPRLFDTGTGVYHRTSLASSSMDAASNADMLSYMANYKLDVTSIKGSVCDVQDINVASLTPAQLQSIGMRQKWCPGMRLRTKSLGQF